MFKVGKKYRGESGVVYTCTYVGKTISMLTFPNGEDSVCYNNYFNIFTEVLPEPTTWIPEVGMTYFNGSQQKMFCCYTSEEKNVSVFLRKESRSKGYTPFSYTYALPTTPPPTHKNMPRNTVLDPVYSEEDFDWISAGTDIL